MRNSRNDSSLKSVGPVLVLLGLALVGAAGVTIAARQRSAPAAAPAEPTAVIARIATAADAFLGSLDPAQRTKAAYPFDSPQKTNWSNLPSGIYQRNSLRLGDMTAPQREAVLTLMSTVLSRDGYEKITNIMNGDEVLKNQGGGRTGGRPGGGGGRGGGLMFGKDEYYIAILGTPSTTTPWMIQFGGHHLGINVTMAGGHGVITPSLPAAQPATYTLNGETIRPLGKENDKAFALINALDATQRSQAVLPYQVNDLVLGPLADGKTIAPEGLLASALTTAQQNMLLDLAHEWVGILNDAAAAERMTEIRANLSKTYFAWSGSTTNGGLAYYRIQGPTLVIEYAPQQGDRDHIHTIYRDPTNDYGAKLVAR
jgi:Protein of unknown function (DUF3500)